MEDLQLDFSGLSCDGGLSIDANLELNLGGDTGGIDLGQIQFPNRQARQILSGTSQARPNLGGVVLGQPGVQLQGTSQARPNLGGVVLAQPGVPLQGHSQARPNFGGVVLAQSGVPLHTAPPTGQQSVQVSSMSYTNHGYQDQPPPYHAPPVTVQQPPYSGAATIITTPNGPPVPQVTHMHNGLPVQTAQLAQMQQRPVVVAPTPSIWMALSIFSVIFCMPLGIIAFVFSYLVNESLKRGDHQEAVRNSNAAMWLNVLAIITGLPLWIFIFYAVY
ncbi:unnamed protein product [Porites evermanni]|uniref:Uncharacterized protein n=1 Tax=Porites evermanni TaxID=104178 RepID=A0ABN8SL49_9CNID|nr:unnamed protein product [Porites evermanni]